MSPSKGIDFISSVVGTLALLTGIAIPYFLIQHQRIVHETPKKRESLDWSSVRPVAISAHALVVGTPIYQFKSSGGKWQVGIGEPKVGQLEVRFLGSLFKPTQAGKNPLPVYLCSFAGFGGKNTAIDFSPNCSGQGDRVESRPLGFVPSDLSAGIQAMMICRDEVSGFYSSTNKQCDESARLQETKISSLQSL
ncbi:MAG: hypothetical protein EOP09_03350 [Proteobacteria bacterium]|nr:MAG: hypothetical protein EOP09_03350 [Pseudomonadota bacterium]